MGGMAAAIVGLLLVIAGIVLFAIAINKTNYHEFPAVVRNLSWIVILLPVSYFLAVISVYMKPRMTGIGLGQKLMQAVKETAREPAPVGTGLVEVEGPIYTEEGGLVPVKPRRTVVEEEVVTVKQSPSRRRVVTTATASAPPAGQTFVVEE
jgi:GNAT superfamily N-acetyltransferase